MEKTKIIASLSLTFLSCAFLDSYVNMPLRYIEDDGSGEKSDIGLLESSKFKSIFYLGKGLGSFIGGVVAYLFKPENVLAVLVRASVTVGFTATGLYCVAYEKSALTYFIWFVVPAAAMAHITCRFIYTLECVQTSWANYVGMGLFGLQWSLGRFYAILAAEMFPNWQARFYVTTFIFYLMTALQDAVPLSRRHDYKMAPKESITRVLNNKLGIRYLVILLLLWILHGGNAYIYKEDYKTQIFVCLTNAASKILVTFLCTWTKKKRAVLATLMALNAVFCISFTVFGLCHFDENVVATLDQVWSFLNTGSLCILWLLTVEIFGCGSRYVILGLCSFSCRISSLLSILSVDADIYLGWPSAVLGFLCILCFCLVFLLPEPKLSGLPLKTRGLEEALTNGESFA